MQIKILEQYGDYEESLRILKKNGLEPLTYQEALLALTTDDVLKEKLKGKWFYLKGKGLDKSGYHTIDKFGDVRAGKEEIEETVYLWKGDTPLSLNVGSDGNAALSGGRFFLNADNEPHDVAPVVLGKLAKPSKADKHKHKFVCECGKVKN